MYIYIYIYIYIYKALPIYLQMANTRAPRFMPSTCGTAHETQCTKSLSVNVLHDIINIYKNRLTIDS